MGALERYMRLTQNPYGTAQNTEQQGFMQTVPEQQVQPQVDSSNAIGSLAAMMGPTPAEREAAERRMRKNQAQMAAWTGLFDGLRQLGNLYYTSKGATPQNLGNAYAQVDQNYQQQRQMYADMANYRRQYATSLYNLRKQMEADQQNKEMHQAKLDWYRNRDEQNAQKVAIQRFNAEANAAYKQAQLDQKDKIVEIQQKLSEGRISLMEAQEQLAKARTAHVGATGGGRGSSNGTYGYEKRKWVDENGVWHEERVPTTGVKPGPAQPSSPKDPKQPKQSPKQPEQPAKEAQGKSGNSNEKRQSKTRI